MARAQSLVHVVPRSVASHAPRATPILSVVMVNFRQWEQTAQLVEQLQVSPTLGSEQAEIVIVDNHSPRHPVVPRLRRQPGVSVRRWGRNQGFARAVNEGCRLSLGKWLLLLNPDTTPCEGFLEGVLERIPHLDERTGIVGFHLRNPDGSQQLSTGPLPTFLGTLGRLLLPRSRRKYQPVHSAQPCQVPWVTGCCLLVRRECWNDLQGLDEDFFLYYEDVDLCRRAAKAGWSVWYDPTLPVVHHHPLHSRAVPAVLRLVLRHSLLTYAAKHWPRWQFRLLARIVQTETWVRRLAARRHGDLHNAQIDAALHGLVADLLRDDAMSARRRLDQTVAKKDLRLGV